MKRAFAFVLLAFSAIAFAQVPQIKSGATVYIEPANGFEIYLSAAFIEVGVPLVVVTDKDKAEYIIKSDAKQLVESSWRTSWTDVSATFSVVDPRSSQIVFAGSSSYRYTLKDAAEKCAKQLNQFITSAEKKGRKQKK
jgi:hypothetical protein